MSKLIFLIIFSMVVFSCATSPKSDRAPRVTDYNPNPVVKASTACPSATDLYKAMVAQMNKRIMESEHSFKTFRFEGAHNVTDKHQKNRFIMNEANCFLTAGSFITLMNERDQIEQIGFTAITEYDIEQRTYETVVVSMEQLD